MSKNRKYDPTEAETVWVTQETERRTKRRVYRVTKLGNGTTPRVGELLAEWAITNLRNRGSEVIVS